METTITGMKPKTSQSHPLQIAAVRAPAAAGRQSGLVGLSFCPGKKQDSAFSGLWDRSLGMDLDAIAAWGAVAVVTLVEPHELEALQVPEMGREVRARHMEWFHLPIRDVSTPTPAFESAWQQVGPRLHRWLRAGCNVFVHCKGGLGRAGTIASRLLIELGMPPRGAIDAIRKVRPGALETHEQEAYALALSPVAEPAPATTTEAIRDRALGALLGLAVGDALGTTLEFAVRDSYEHLTDLVGGGPFGLQPGQWTDDTSLALALADSLVAHPTLNPDDLIQRFWRWYREGEYSCTGHCFDIGSTTRTALERWKREGEAYAGSVSAHAAGNGSLMRLAPVAVRHWRQRDTLRDVAARQSRTTHASPEAVDACVMYAEALADAIEGKPHSEVLRHRPDGYAGRIDPIAQGSWRQLPRHEVRASGYVAHSLEASLWSTARGTDYRSAVLLAANLGEDADTTAAITGQLAGALHGASGIPAEWLARLAWRERLESVASSLVGASLL